VGAALGLCVWIYREGRCVMTYKRELAEAIRHVTNVAVWLLEQADQEESRGRGEWVVDTEDRVVSLLRGADQDAEDHERYICEAKGRDPDLKKDDA
jgi:predicted RNA-binding protein with PUA domain